MKTGLGGVQNFFLEGSNTPCPRFCRSSAANPRVTGWLAAQCHWHSMGSLHPETVLAGVRGRYKMGQLRSGASCDAGLAHGRLPTPSGGSWPNTCMYGGYSPDSSLFDMSPSAPSSIIILQSLDSSCIPAMIVIQWVILLSENHRVTPTLD